MTTTDAPTRRPDLTIVVPTYNERPQLDSLLEQVFSACDSQGLVVELIIVDDNSKDGTGARADDWALRRRVRVIHRTGKLGLGSAVIAGVGIAESDIVGVMDADLSHPPRLVPALFSAMCGADLDMVIASRYVQGGGTASWPLARRMLSRLACWMARPLTPVRDPMSGFFLIRRDRVSGLRYSTRGFKIGLDLLVRSKPRRVAEVAYVFVGRAAGKSKLSIGEGFRFLRQLIGLYRLPIVRPSHVMASLGSEWSPPASAVVRRRG